MLCYAVEVSQVCLTSPLNGINLQVKPVDKSSWWRRLRVDSSGNLAIRSHKLHWWVLTLDLEGSINPIQKTTAGSFRVATKWDIVRGEYRNKKAFRLGDATEGRIHWSVNYNLPEVAGSFGTGSRTMSSRDVHAEVGYAHAEVAKVELVVWPWRSNLQKETLNTVTQSGDALLKEDDQGVEPAPRLTEEPETSSTLGFLQSFIRKLGS